MKGSSIYLSANEVEALHAAASYLGQLIESSSGEVPDLFSAKEGLHTIIDKADKARQATGRRARVKKALKELSAQESKI
ncbi:hypothetical protein [Pseudomonas sp. NPDC096950]|uniref:hypothetical protein n=1 Tax=Pseudomonas sp. NPDC096950 TaxID=3364485 RepID=UPI00383B8C2E